MRQNSRKNADYVVKVWLYENNFYLKNALNLVMQCHQLAPPLLIPRIESPHKNK
jgi:hypothetical protein